MADSHCQGLRNARLVSGLGVDFVDFSLQSPYKQGAFSS